MADVTIDENKLQAAVMPQLERFTAGFVSRVATQAREIAPRRTGRLVSSISADGVRRAGPWHLSSGVTVGVPYAAPVHEGARPHLIRPRFARALRFEVGGRVVFAQLVHHPGNRANPFLTNAAHRVASADPRITLGDL